MSPKSRNILAVIIALGACATMLVFMTSYSIFLHWLSAKTSRLEFIGCVIVLLSATMATGIWMEKREQKRLGIKRPLFRWTND